MNVQESKKTNVVTISRLAPRILLGSDNHRLATSTRNMLLKAGYRVDLASDYSRLELLWLELRHEIVLIEVSRRASIEPATAIAVRIKRFDAQQFVGYLTDTSLQMSGLIGDAVFSRDSIRLPQTLRTALHE